MEPRSERRPWSVISPVFQYLCLALLDVRMSGIELNDIIWSGQQVLNIRGFDS